MDFNAIIDAVREATGAKSDSELNRMLGLSHGAINNYRKERALPDIVTCEKIAKILGKKPLSFIAEVEQARARDSETKAVWRRLATAAVLMIAMIPALSHATIRHTLTEAGYMHYAKLNMSELLPPAVLAATGLGTAELDAPVLHSRCANTA